MRITQPKYRSPLRKYVGREYHILKRKWRYLNSSVQWAHTLSEQELEHEVFRHKSLILRPLAGVDMQLQENKRTNLALASQHINSIVIRPGETFSFWKLVGRPRKRKGYLTGLVLENGEAKEGSAGGLCQLGNLLFWLFIHSPLTITERHRHGFDVFPDVKRKVPFGAGATLAYNNIDLQVTNTTDCDFQIKLRLDNTHLLGELRSNVRLEDSYEIEEVNHHIRQQSWGGYSRHNQILQRIKKPDQSTSEKIILENHAIMMYEPFLE